VDQDRSFDQRYRRQRDRAARAGHEYVFRFWDELDGVQRAELIAQVEQIDFDLVAELYNQLSAAGSGSASADSIEPATDVVRLPRTDAEMREDAEARRLGTELIAAGKVAAVTVAGGQGTRLGYDGPKGCYPFGPVTGRPLFEWHALRLRAAARSVNRPIPWYIMTSTNDAATREFFVEHGHFGLADDDVSFFVQETLPAVSPTGRLFLDRQDHVFESPNGHGGSFRALARSGALEDMDRRGIEYISYFQVDNSLVLPADPRFLGHHVMRQAEMSGKTIRKRSWDEPVGVFCVLDGKLRIVEYTEMPEEAARATDSDGNLRFWAGNSAIHIISTDFAERIGNRPRPLPYHCAFKRIPYIDDQGRQVRPDKPNGYKFESFVFDALAETERTMLMEIERERQYAPVKNNDKSGPGSVAVARQAAINLFGSWLERAGVDVPRDPQNGDVVGHIEISPIYASSAEELETRVDPGTTFVQPMLLE